MQAIGEFVDAIYGSNYRSVGEFRSRMRAVADDDSFWEVVKRLAGSESERCKLERSLRSRLRSRR
jgi:hypothetical protein